MSKFYKIVSLLSFSLAIVAAVTYAKEEPFLAFICGFFGVALGIVLYEISETRELLQALKHTTGLSEHITHTAMVHEQTRAAAPMHK